MITIYGVTCKPNGKCYVGSTKAKLAKRMREHRCLLANGKHACAGMQSDWREFGHEQFVAVELEIFLYDESLPTRREAELRWMEHFKSKGLLYNEHLISMRPTEEARQRGVANAHNEPGNRWTPEVNLKRSLAQKGIPKGHGAKISATKRARRLQVMR